MQTVDSMRLPQSVGNHHPWQSHLFLRFGQFVLNALKQHTMPFPQHDGPNWYSKPHATLSFA